MKAPLSPVPLRWARPGTALLSFLAAVCLLNAPPAWPSERTPRAFRRFTFVYEVSAGPFPAGAGPIDVFIPMASSDLWQFIHHRKVHANIPGRERIEPEYGNRYWHGRVERSAGQRVEVAVEYEVTRRRSTSDPRAGLRAGAPGPVVVDRYLEPDRLVPTSGQEIEEILATLPVSGQRPLERARDIFDHVIDNMRYAKDGVGWGNGDTHWACRTGYGNCTDFHALQMSLSRASDIPTRFEIGFPIPEDRPSGVVAGYHCWVSLWLPGQGWLPADASEAWKSPERRELLFGTLPPDRILFSIGRDLVLPERGSRPPLNFFIYPLVEVAGKQVGDVRTRFTFRTRGSDLALRRAGADTDPLDGYHDSD